MLGGSPISVAAPCKLLDIAIAIIIFTGFILILCVNVSAIGAIIKTVATFSIKVDMNEVKIHIDKTAQAAFFALSMIISAINAGTLLFIKTSATASMPINIPKTFQFTARKALSGETVLVNKRSTAPLTEIKDLLSGKTTNKR